MYPPIFYVPPDLAHGPVIPLPPAEAHHALKVLRLSEGNEIIGVDGQGVAYRGQFRRNGRTGVELVVTGRVEGLGEPAARITVAAGLSQAGKFDEIVERCTELGAYAIVPLLTEKSKIRVSDSRWADRKVERLRQVAIAAMKQCRRSRLPMIATPTLFADLLKKEIPAEVRLIFSPSDTAESLDQTLPSANVHTVTLLVGPESGFSADEVTQARRTGYSLVQLGPRILRAETAAPTALALVMARLGGFSH